MQCNQVVKALLLDDATAAKFTPVYMQYLKELSESRVSNSRKFESKGDSNARKCTKNGTEVNPYGCRSGKSYKRPVCTEP